MELKDDLTEALRAAFITPYASHRWRSSRGRSYWVDLEGWQDALAGPLSSIIERGDCEYVYARDDQFFAGVTDPESLKIRLLEWHAKLAARVEQFIPAYESETYDHVFMRSIVRTVRELIERAVEVESRRWHTLRSPAG